MATALRAPQTNIESQRAAARGQISHAPALIQPTTLPQPSIGLTAVRAAYQIQALRLFCPRFRDKVRSSSLPQKNLRSGCMERLPLRPHNARQSSISTRPVCPATFQEHTQSNPTSLRASPIDLSIRPRHGATRRRKSESSASSLLEPAHSVAAWQTKRGPATCPHSSRTPP